MEKTNMKRKAIIVTLTFLLALPAIAIAQESNLGNWLIYIGNKKLNSKWNIHNEVQYRNYNAIGDLEQLLLRTGVGYNLNEKNNVLLGYGYILSENYLGDSDDKISVNEHRIFQQYITKQTVGSVTLSHRYRFEQRFVENDFKMRFRYFLSLNVPLKNNESGESPLYLSAYNEIFLNSKSSIFDRNRVYGGLGYNLNKNIKLELGYMNQFFETDSRDQINIITFINF
jgi:opacity protein-like surface antigen